MCDRLQVGTTGTGRPGEDNSVPTVMEKSATLGTSQDQTLFIPVVLNDQGGGVMNISYDKTATLRAQDHGHPPVVLEKQDDV